MSDRRVQIENLDGICTITLDSPHNRNALSTQLVAELTSALDDAAADDAVRIVVLTHTGGTFCAGADLSESSATNPQMAPFGLIGVMRRIVESPKPVIGRIDGHVRAGGTGLLAATDIAICSSKATFAFTESLLGLAPAVISLTLLPRLTSRAANRYYLTGEKFGIDIAAQIGLISIASSDLDADVTAMCNQLRLASPQGLRESKALQNRDMLAYFDSDAERLVALSLSLFESEEAHEGMKSFLEKRPPRWVQ